MKLYMIKKKTQDGKWVYRSAGMYDRWTSQGKCWSGRSFKSFLNYWDGNLKTLKNTEDCFVIEVDTESISIVEVPFVAWCRFNGVNLVE